MCVEGFFTRGQKSVDKPLMFHGWVQHFLVATSCRQTRLACVYMTGKGEFHCSPATVCLSLVLTSRWPTGPPPHKLFFVQPEMLRSHAAASQQGGWCRM